MGYVLIIIYCDPNILFYYSACTKKNQLYPLQRTGIFSLYKKKKKGIKERSLQPALAATAPALLPLLLSSGCSRRLCTATTAIAGDRKTVGIHRNRWFLSVLLLPGELLLLSI
jgi:hypothetical protein